MRKVLIIFAKEIKIAKVKGAYKLWIIYRYRILLINGI